MLWEVMLVMFSTYDQTKKSSGFGSATWRTWLAWGSLSSQSRSGLSGACRTYTPSPPSHMHSQLCVRHLNFWQSAVKAAGEFHQWLPGSFRWTPWSGSSWQCPQPWASTPPPPKGCPMCWAVTSSIEPSGFAFWGCWQWFCCHNLDR